MKAIYKLSAIAVLIAGTSACQTTSDTPAVDVGFKVGDTVQALVNIHTDYSRKKIYALNYQLPTLIPVCSKFTIDAISTKNIKVTYKEQQYSYLWDRHTRKAGQSLAQNFNLVLGEKCDTNKLNKLSKLDKKGVKKGVALIGMSKQGVIFAMGHAPVHATQSVDSQRWLYWRNKWGKRAIEFSEKGKVINIQ